MIHELIQERNAAVEAVRKELERLYPLGYEVQVLLTCRQKYPSPATVIDWSGSRGTVKVRLHNAKKFSRRSVRDISHRYIVAVGGKAKE